MSQLFNPSDPMHASANNSQTPPPPSNSYQAQPQQMFRRKPKFNVRARVFGVLAILMIAGALPAIVLLSRQQQTYQGSAHTPQPKVTAACDNGSVNLTSYYTIQNVPSGVSCNVTATDSENFLNDSFSVKNDGNHTKTANTDEPTITPGVVTFKTSCGDGFKSTNQVSYSYNGSCAPSPSISPTPTPSPVPSATPSPSVCVTPGQVQHVKVSCPNCTGQ